MIYYVLVCLECDGDGPVTPLPFESADARGRWASEHTKGTGHDRWVVTDQVLS
jgi:hypothetical protein